MSRWIERIVFLFILALAIFYAYGRVNIVPKTYTNKVQEKKHIRMDLTSDAFEDKEAIPSNYTCDGENINPPLSIGGVPDDAESLVLLVTDPDAPAGTWTHWVVFNIPPEIDEIGEDSVPEGALQGVNDFGNVGWGGPCPPSGTHRYIFTVYALDTTLDLPEGADRQAVETAMEGHILDQAELIGVYKKSSVKN